MPVVPHLIMDISGDTLTHAARTSGFLMFAFASMQFIASPVLGNLSDRFGRRPVLLCSLLAMVCNYLLMGWAPTLFWLFVGRLIGGVSASTYGIANAYVADTFPAEKRAQYFALLGAGFGTGFIVGPALGGFLGEYGPRTPFYAAAGSDVGQRDLRLFCLAGIPEGRSTAARLNWPAPIHWAHSSNCGSTRWSSP